MQICEWAAGGARAAAATIPNFRPAIDIMNSNTTEARLYTWTVEASGTRVFRVQLLLYRQVNERNTTIDVFGSVRFTTGIGESQRTETG